MNKSEFYLMQICDGTEEENFDRNTYVFPVKISDFELLGSLYCKIIGFSGYYRFG